MPRCWFFTTHPLADHSTQVGRAFHETCWCRIFWVTWLLWGNLLLSFFIFCFLLYRVKVTNIKLNKKIQRYGRKNDLVLYHKLIFHSVVSVYALFSTCIWRMILPLTPQCFVFIKFILLSILFLCGALDNWEANGLYHHQDAAGS